MSEEIKVVETQTTEELQGSVPSQETKPKYSEAETTAYNLRKQAEKAKELGLNPVEILGIKTEPAPAPKLDENEPLTVGKLKEMQQTQAQQEAFKLLDSIEDEMEREAVREILKTRIVPSGNAAADIAIARSAVNSVRNARIAEEATRKTAAPRTAAGGSSDAPKEVPFEPTEQERIFMAPPYNLSKEELIKLRNKMQ